MPLPVSRIKLLLLVALLPLCACATATPPLAGIVPGRGMETLQSAIAISARAGDQKNSGRGFLLFKAPDRFHVALVNPFGLALLETFSDADRFTCLLPSRQVAYAGVVSELPENSVFKSLGMMRWVIALPAREETGAPRETVTASGDRVFVDQRGLVVRKVSGEGDEAIYRDYRNVNGVAFPGEIEVRNRFGATVKIVFDDPEINQPVEESALVPDLEGYRLLPLSDFKGI